MLDKIFIPNGTRSPRQRSRPTPAEQLMLDAEGRTATLQRAADEKLAAEKVAAVTVSTLPK